MIGDTARPAGRVMQVTFIGFLPDDTELFGATTDVTGKLKEIFGFTQLGHLTVTDTISPVAAEEPSP